MSGTAVLIPALLTSPSSTPWQLWLVTCVLHQRTTFVYFQPAEFRRKGATLSLARRAMEPGHLLYSALTCPLNGMHAVSNRDIHLCPPHNNSWVHLTTTTYVRRSGQITDGMQSGWTTL